MVRGGAVPHAHAALTRQLIRLMVELRVVVRSGSDEHGAARWLMPMRLPETPPPEPPPCERLRGAAGEQAGRLYDFGERTPSGLAASRTASA